MNPNPTAIESFAYDSSKQNLKEDIAFDLEDDDEIWPRSPDLPWRTMAVGSWWRIRRATTMTVIRMWISRKCIT
ncbi:hypothetical protein CFP56_001062 [Quercus suber]|uniref:Uncharacterized protein n=1 Tax=Quercus suber TaxID=58331 RepID=A0AAW0IN66_QUESU|nr:hypothetical protein CFP56_73270 [Quercus suber]